MHITKVLYVISARTLSSLASSFSFSPQQCQYDPSTQLLNASQITGTRASIKYCTWRLLF